MNSKSISFFLLGLLIICSPACNQSSSTKSNESAAGKAQLDAELARVRAAGEPASLTELGSMFSIRSSTNAATTYEKAFASLRGDFEKFQATETQVNSIETTAPLPSELRNTLANLCAQNKEPLALLHMAAKIEGCEYPIDFEHGLQNMHLPHLEKIKNCALLLELAVTLAAEQGNAKEAVESIADLLGLGASLKNEPVEASQSVRILCNRLSFVALRRVLNRVQLDDDELTILYKDFTAAENLETFTRTCLGERAILIVLIQMPPDSFRSAPHADDIAFCLSTMKELIASSHTSGLEFTELKTAFDARLTEAAEKRYTFANQALATLINLIDKYAADITCIRCAKNALAVERYRLAHQNQLPTTLNDIVPVFVPALLSDAYNGTPFQYRKQSASLYEISSSGQDATKWVTFRVERQ